MINLNNAALPTLAAELPVPTYDRMRQRAGIVHVGVSHFHRAHQAMYVDKLMRAGLADDWAICGVGVRAGGSPSRAALAAQDNLYTLTVKAPDGAKHDTVIGALHDYLYAPDNPRRVVDKLADPDTRIVSLTISEGGYDTNDVTGEFLGASPEVRADLRAVAPNRSVFGLLFQAAELRRKNAAGGLTILSCDNNLGNGAVARAAFLGFAEAREPGLAAWMAREFTFPNSMVDRLTPQTVPADIEHLEQAHGYHDGAPVTCEPFTQWVIEDDFAAGRPPWQEAGVELVADVKPFETAKLRLANGAHQTLGYFGYLLGYHHVHEALGDPDIRALVFRYHDEEALPTLRPIPGTDLRDYGRSIVARYSSPGVKDPLPRICAYTTDRIPKFLLPVARERLAAGGRAPICAAVLASWARWAQGVDEHGQPIEVIDPLREEIMAAARASRTAPESFLADRKVFGDLGESAEFVADFADALTAIQADGARSALRQLMARSPDQ
ncbi:MAG: mannitol dehydrogenase family protein [Actinomycetia bacterium]|nr:mannitol dehydrogenase family protein [Actinomycetes bacterium]